MKKKIFALLAVLAMLCTLVACGGAEAEAPAEAPEASAENEEAVVISGKICLPIPEGFEFSETEGVDEMYICEDGSNINVLAGEPDPTIEVVDEETLVEVLGEAYETQMGASISAVSFSNEDVLGCPAYQFVFQVEVEGMTFTQYQLAAQSDKLYTWTLTDMTGEHAAEFEACLAGVYLED